MQEETSMYASNLMGYCLKQDKIKTTLQGEPQLTFSELVEEMIFDIWPKVMRRIAGR